MNYYQTEGSKTTKKNPRYVCKKCVYKSRSYNSQSECKRHIQTFHYGFMYKCTGCGKVYTRKIKRKHNCSSKSRYVLIHKESGLIDTSAVQKRKYLDDQINNDIQKEFNSLPLQMPSRDLESIIGVSHHKHYKIKRTYHPYRLNHIKPQLQQIQKEADPSLDLDFVHDPSEIIISQPLAFDENEVEPGSFSDILTTSNELSQVITENSLVQNIQLLGGSDSGLKHEDKLVFDENEVEPGSLSDILNTSNERSHAITEYSPEQNIQRLGDIDSGLKHEDKLAFDENEVEPGSLSDIINTSNKPSQATTEYSPEQNIHLLGDIDSGLKHEDELEKMVGKETEIINHKMVQTQHWQDDSVILCVGGNPFVIRKSTLMKGPTSFISKLCKLNVTPKSQIFIDRDPSHFKFILNFLMYDCVMPIGCLPNDLQVLNELKEEAIYFCLPKLEDDIQRKIEIMEAF